MTYIQSRDILTMNLVLQNTISKNLPDLEKANFRKMEIESMGYYIGDNYISSISQEKLKLIDAIHNETLIFFFSTLQCDMCVDFAMEEIAKLQDSEKRKIIIISDFKNFQAAYTFKHRHQINTSLYSLSHPLQLSIEKSSLPFFVLVNKKGIILNSFIVKNKGEKAVEAYICGIMGILK